MRYYKVVLRLPSIAGNILYRYSLSVDLTTLVPAITRFENVVYYVLFLHLAYLIAA
jgi:hypothetical protein